MNTFLSTGELQELAGGVEDFNNRYLENTLTFETKVIDANGEFVGYITYKDDDNAYVFVDDLSVLD